MNIIVRKRFPSLIERFIFNITCIGFCEGNNLEYLPSCLQLCNKQNLLKAKNVEDNRIEVKLIKEIK